MRKQGLPSHCSGSQQYCISQCRWHVHARWACHLKPERLAQARCRLHLHQRSAVVRAMAISWHVFNQTLQSSTFLLALLADYSYCMLSFLSQHAAGNTARDKLVGRIACICVAYTFPMLYAAVTDAMHSRDGVEACCYGGAVACLVISALLCQRHWPESLAPGSWDYFSSHAIMHVLVHIEYLIEWWFIVHMTMQKLQHASQAD